MVAELKPITGSLVQPAPWWQRFLGYGGAAVLGAVLLLAAWGKMLDPAAFVEQIRLEGLDAWLPAPAVAFVALGLEVGLGLALLLNLRRWWVLLPATALVIFFTYLTGHAWYLSAHGLRAADASCGCFGNLVERTPAEAFWQDLLLLVPPLLLAFLARPAARRLPKGRLALVLMITFGALVFAWAAPQLPLDDLATRLKPGLNVAERCTGAADSRVCLHHVVPELLHGESVVVLADLAADDFVAAVARLNDYAIAGQGPRLWVLTAATPEALRRFQWTQGPAFELREAPPALLRPMYRTLPRSFLVRDGKVVSTYRGLPPFGQLAASGRRESSEPTPADAPAAAVESESQNPEP